MHAPRQFSPTLSQPRRAYSVCRHIARSAAKNFYYGFAVLLLVQTQLAERGVCSCAAATTSPTTTVSSASTSVATNCGVLDSIHRAPAGYPTDEALYLPPADTQRRYQIPIGLLDQLAYGTGVDVEQESLAEGQAATLAPRYRTFDQLQQYCYGVASVVGLCCILGFWVIAILRPKTCRTLVYFSLTNIIRDEGRRLLWAAYFPEDFGGGQSLRG